MEKLRKISLILFGPSDLPVVAYKDSGMFLYELAKTYNWSSEYLFFKTGNSVLKWSKSFTEYVSPICIGNAVKYQEQVELAKNISKNMLRRLMY